MMNDNITSSTQVFNRTKIIDDYSFYILQFVVYVVLINLVSLFGMLANMINIAVFIKMGLKTDSSTVSFLGLAVADLGGVASLLAIGILTTIDYLEIKDLNWSPLDIVYIAGWVHILCAQLTCFVTAYIACERCVCVVFPFQVKIWFSPKRTAFAVFGVMAFIALCYVPAFFTLRLPWQLDPTSNDSRLVLVISKDTQSFITMSDILSNTIATATILIVMVCTKLLISHIQSSSKIREKASSSVTPASLQNESATKQQHTSTASLKEKTLFKMVTVFCIIFMICYIPIVLISYVRQFYTDIRHGGPYHNLFHVIYSIGFFMEDVNSSVNIIAYYTLSARYREVFGQLFRTK